MPEEVSKSLITESQENVIYCIVGFTELPSIDEVNTEGPPVVFGYYRDYDYTVARVEENALDINEKSFDYMLIEKVGTGIYPNTEQLQWFQYNPEQERFEKIEFKAQEISNFSMG